MIIIETSNPLETNKGNNTNYSNKIIATNTLALKKFDLARL